MALCQKLATSLPSRAYAAFVPAIACFTRTTVSNRTVATASGLSACMAVSRQGTLSLDPTQSAPILEQPPAARSRLRTLVLNRQSALNALNLEMLQTLTARVSALDKAETVDAILLTASPGRAFCAGGDVRFLYDAGCDGNYEPAAGYFRAEYSLDWLLAGLRNTVLISILDGITMGGGAGISMHGRFRIATENTLFAMPECAIGLHPDVGMSYVLSRLPGGIGMYLGLTGARLKGSEAVSAGIATHYVQSHLLPGLRSRLAAANTASAGAVSRAIGEFASSEPLQPVPHLGLIDEFFTAKPSDRGKTNVETILARLSTATKGEGVESKFAQDTLAMIRKGCPMSLKVTHEAMMRARDMPSVKECLEMDYRLAVRATRRADLYAGVKSAVVTRDKNPAWNPSKLEDISEEDVQNYFKPLSNLGLQELELVGLSEDAETTPTTRQSRI
jgi:enoyl-CoA hydratase/carnithine racemase